MSRIIWSSVGELGKVARLPSPRTYSAVVPLGVLNLPLNALQSAELNAPLLVALAVGRLKVCVDVAELIPKSVPLVPVAKFCTCAVKPFSAFNPVVNVVMTWQRLLSSVCRVILRPDGVTKMRTASLSVASKVVEGTASALTYKSTAVPPVMASGFVDPEDMSVKVAPSYLYNST